MRGPIIASIVAGLILGAAAAIAIFPEARELVAPTGSQTSGTALIGGPFTLTDTSGKTVTEKDFAGRYTLMFFGFTHCPDICPAGLQLISAALAKVGDKASNVTPVFVSVDPARDTPEVVANYLKNFSAPVVGLTGTPEQIAEIAKAYRVYYEKTPNQDVPEDYGMNHTSIIYLMGPDGSYVTHFTPTTDVNAMADKLDKVL